MKITFYGTGSAFNHKHGNNSALLEFNDTNLLLDCGHTTSKYLAEKNMINKINNIWISHMHGDHIGGLEELAFQNKFIYNRKINLFVPLEIYINLKTYLECTMKYTQEGYKTIEEYFNICTVEKHFIINNTLFEIEKTNHIKNMSAFILKFNNVIYTSDTQFIDWSKRNIEHINYIFQDTQLYKYGNDVHATLENLLCLPENVRKKIYCMHYGCDIDNFKTIMKNNKLQWVNSFEPINLKEV